jgi:hypothetical protein
MLLFQGEGGNGQAGDIPPSGNVGHGGAGQANTNHALDPRVYITCQYGVMMI